MSFSKFISCCLEHSPLLSPQTAKPIYYSSLRKTFFAAFLQKNNLHHSSTSHPPIHSSISGDLCSWVLSCCNSRSLKEGVCVHSPIIKLGFQDHLFLNNNLLCMYFKCFGIEDARNLFEEMSHRDVVSWTGIISAYVKVGDHKEALNLFNFMLDSGLVPNEYTFSSVLRSCSFLEEFELGIRTQAQIIKLGFESNPILGSSLIDFYSKYGCFVEASEIFKAINNGDTVSWTAMISSFVQAKEWSRAVRLYLQMIEVRITPNEFTFVKLLMACGFLGLEYGKLVHAHVVLWGIKLNLVLKTALVDMYSKCQRMDYALTVSKQTFESDVLLWTALITGYTQASDFQHAIAAFCDMEMAGISPNPFTYAGILNICSSIEMLELGKQIHSRVVKAGLEWDVSVGNGLVDMYMKCSSMVGDAFQAFKGIISPNVVSWSSLIAGFAQGGLEHEAFQAFLEMRVFGMEPNSITFSGILKGCVTIESLSQVQKLHAYLLKIKAHSDITIGNALVDVYARLGMVGDAWNVINMMTHRDVITYTSLATGINQMGHHEMTLSIIAHMKDENVKMDGFSLSSFLSASASLAAIEPGKQLHCYSVKSGLCSWISVANGLVDLYGKCGSINDVHIVFEEILEPNIVSWNGLISGLASNGHVSSALSGFEDMRMSGIQPDHITFLLVLYACSHGGLVDKGVEYFYSMSKTYGVEPKLDHYVCLVDLLSRGGQLEKAVGVIETMPFRPDALIYKTLLGSCKVHRNVALGEDMARRALELDPFDPAVYVLLANIYDDAGRSKFGDLTRQMMRERGLRKNPGQSWVEVRNKVHLFTAGDQTHPQINAIHGKIECLKVGLKRDGHEYVDNAGSSYHSEKLAIAFAILNTPSMAPIRIIKNLRICKDCHNFMRLVSQLVGREIVVRDGNRFHLFKKGDCTCQGYW